MQRGPVSTPLAPKPHLVFAWLSKGERYTDTLVRLPPSRQIHRLKHIEDPNRKSICDGLPNTPLGAVLHIGSPTIGKGIVSRHKEELIVYHQHRRPGRTHRQNIVDARAKSKPERRRAIFINPLFEDRAQIRPPRALRPAHNRA